jgi:hypothetical protein
MDTALISRICEVGSVMCLVIAFIWYQMEKVQRAAIRSVNEYEREALRRLQRDVERSVLTLANLHRVQVLPVKTPRQTDRKPAKKKAAPVKR